LHDDRGKRPQAVPTPVNVAAERMHAGRGGKPSSRCRSPTEQRRWRPTISSSWRRRPTCLGAATT
jgi:hypothetical protein